MCWARRGIAGGARQRPTFVVDHLRWLSELTILKTTVAPTGVLWLGPRALIVNVVMRQAWRDRHLAVAVSTPTARSLSTMKDSPALGDGSKGGVNVERPEEFCQATTHDIYGTWRLTVPLSRPVKSDGRVSKRRRSCSGFWTGRRPYRALREWRRAPCKHAKRGLRHCLTGCAPIIGILA